MILSVFRKAIILLLPFVYLLESPAFSSPESIFKQQSKKPVLLSQNTPSPTSTSSPGVVRKGRIPVKKTGPIKPQYESCKGKDIYKLNSEFQDKSHLGATEAIGPCIECFMNPPSAASDTD